MSAPELREAASLMCDRAETANEGSWRAQSGSAECNAGVLTLSGLPVATTYCNTDAEHIASWHPAVALAVADWLDLAAEWVEAHPGSNPPWVERAHLVATAYLGGSS